LKGAGALPQNVEIATVEDQSIAIKESITGLIKEGLIGALFAVIVIFIFLRNLRLTLVAAVSIPTSVLASFILMSLAGLSLNIFTLGALAIAIGRVVDDSIVVLENIARRYGQGDALGTAILEGTREVAGAITASTLTTAAVFMPIGLVGGITSQFFLPFALTVVFALITSLIVSLTIIPVFAKLFIGRRSSFKDEPEGRLERFYLRSLRWTLGHRALSLVLAVILLVASFGLTPFIGTAFLPASGQKLIRIAATAPAGSSHATTDALAKALESEVARGANLETYATTVGANARELAFGAGGTTNVSVSALYTEAADVEAEADRLRLAARSLPNLDNINIEVVQNGPPGQNQLQVIVTGNDFAQVSAASERVLTATSEIAGLNNFKSDLVAAKPEISVKVDPNKAAARGLNGVAVAGQVRSLITGQSVTQVALPSGRVEVYALFATGQEQAAVAQLENLTVFGATGPVRVGDVATVERGNGPTQILRVDRERAVTITATVTGDNLGAVTSDTQAAIDGLGLPAGVNATVGGAAEAQNETFAALGVALLVAIVLVYIVMVGTFGNLRDPFVILFSLPLAIIGAIVALFVTQRALGLPALIGLLLLIGIVVTNAIVLLDRVKQQREKGQPYREALLEAGRTRLRPILMTAFATILALVPLALGLNEGAIVAAELATVVIGGLFTSTLLTLLIVPAVYSLFEDAVERINRRRGRGDDEGVGEATVAPDGQGTVADEPLREAVAAGR
jgi:HAE1 family hydrophobic/amphiphilic exporter-1